MRRKLLLSSGSKEFQKHLIGYYPFDDDYIDGSVHYSLDKIYPYVNLSSTTDITNSAGRIGDGVWCPASTNNVLRNNSSSDRHKYSFTNGTNDLPFSISVHCYIRSVGSAAGTSGVIWGKNNDGGTGQNVNAEYNLMVSPGSTTITFTKYSEGTQANYIRYTITAPPLNTWFYLVITDDAFGDVKFYINGIEQYKITTTGGTGFVKFAQTTSSFVGSFNMPGNPSAVRFLDGGLDDLGIFKNYVLTQEDIDWIWNGGNPRRLKK